jgi:hypothetical protein
MNKLDINWKIAMINKFTPERPLLSFVTPKKIFGESNKINPKIIEPINIRSVFFLLTVLSVVFIRTINGWSLTDIGLCCQPFNLKVDLIVNTGQHEAIVNGRPGY